MNGVTILDTIEIYTLSVWQFILGFAPLIIAGPIYLRLCHKGNNAFKIILLPFIGAVLSLVLIFCLSEYYPADYVETRYKVTVDETTSFVEFHDKYNIVEEQSEYLIVTEKSE